MYLTDFSSITITGFFHNLFDGESIFGFPSKSDHIFGVWKTLKKRNLSGRGIITL
jgi:hypothetical protein